ncbi:MAG: YceI family protein [Deltaproteobacteria bacterium]|nr:MAG: YceI family protein [Deltaproteobacteria bacterium]
MKATRLDASTAECLVFTKRAGLLAGVGHDLTLRVERFEVAIDPDSIRGRFDAASLRVVCASVGGQDAPGALSERDRREIEATIAREVLDAQSHPWIEFRASLPVLAGAAGSGLEGVLALRGRERPLTIDVRHEGDRAVALASIHQPDFGIRPYTAMLGALRVRPDVGVRLTAPWSE